MTSTTKRPLSEINDNVVYSAREIFQFDTQFAHSVQLNKFLVADMCNDNILKTMMNKTKSKTRFFVLGSNLKKLNTLSKEYINDTISKYEASTQK